VIIKAGSKCVAVGECGLDYDRLFCSPKETQIRVFEAHFALAEKYKLPLYLHSRNAREDFLRIIKANRKRFSTGLVHCYTGGLEELQELINEGMYFSVNAYAFKE
jgi:TatD DNase family protein